MFGFRFLLLLCAWACLCPAVAQPAKRVALLIGNAADEGQIALDGSGNSSPYAGALTKALRRNDWSLMGQLDWVAREVSKEAAKIVNWMVRV